MTTTVSGVCPTSGFTPEVRAGRWPAGIMYMDGAFLLAVAATFPDRVAAAASFHNGSVHGWINADLPVYDHPAAEQHWSELIDLFTDTLIATQQ